ncbi:MAG: phage tail tape measure protein [Hyphomicrobiaceae bacterium]
MPEPADPAATLTVAVNADTTQLQQQLADCSRLGIRLGTTLASAFDAIAIKGKSLGDVLGSLALSLSRMVLNAAFKPLDQAIGGALAGLVGGGAAFARGGVIRQGLPLPFADGGVIASPIGFPLAGGRAGIAGERGPEAILPLARGPDGRLGVAASNAAAPLQVTVNIATPDVEGFRRSETQIAAMLARAVAQGQRNS